MELQAFFQLRLLLLHVWHAIYGAEAAAAGVAFKGQYLRASHGSHAHIGIEILRRSGP